MDILNSNERMDLVNDWLDMVEEGIENSEIYSITKERIRNDYDANIWDFVDENEVDFDDVLIDLVDEIEMRVEEIISSRE